MQKFPKKFSDIVQYLTLLISFAPNHAESAPKGGEITLIPVDMDWGRCSWSSFANLSGKKRMRITSEIFVYIWSFVCTSFLIFIIYLLALTGIFFIMLHQ